MWTFSWGFHFQLHPTSPPISCLDELPVCCVESRLHCKAALRNLELHVGKDVNDESFWLINDSASNQSLSARELFGFNVGGFSELTTGLEGLIGCPQTMFR